MRNIFFVILPIIILVLISNIISEKKLIPEDAIRIRVIAQSNSREDQTTKLKIKSELEEYLYPRLEYAKSISEADLLIKSSLNSVDSIVSKYTNNYIINYGLNYFPAKEYKGVVYDEGNYNSLVVTLGSGLGENWWCVLFPPICQLEAKESTDVEYRSIVADTINKYMTK